MAKDTEVIVQTIKNVSKLVNTGNENSLLTLSVLGASQAKTLAPVNKKVGVGGQLRNSIQYVTGTGKSGGLNDNPGDSASGSLSVSLRRYEAAIGATALYAPYQEFGTRYIPPQPFLRPSMALIAGESAKVVKAKMDYEFAKGPLKYGQSRVKF